MIRYLLHYQHNKSIFTLAIAKELMHDYYLKSNLFQKRHESSVFLGNTKMIFRSREWAIVSQIHRLIRN